MGYFSNGTEGELYRERYCEHCVHDGNHDDDPFCPVWNLHLRYCHGRDKTATTDAMLEVLIPRSDDGLGNKECAMFRQQHETPLLDLLDA